MADYINSNILCQSYVHVEPAWLTGVSQEEKQKRINLIKEEIKSFSEKRIKFFFYDDVDIDISFEDGSIIAKVTAYGNIALLLGNFVGGYGDFRESVKVMVSDAQRVANVLNLETIFQTESRSKKEIIRVESRKGIIGSLEKINNKIDAINNKLKSNDNSPAVINKDIADLHIFIIDLMSKINSSEDVDSITKALFNGVEDFNLKKGRFKISDDIDQYSYDALKKERQQILDNLKKYREDKLDHHGAEG